jgi:hypothetical protein
MSTVTKTTPKPSYKDRKFTPRPAKTAEERLPQLYRALTDQVDGAHFQNAIKTCKKSELSRNIGEGRIMQEDYNRKGDVTTSNLGVERQDGVYTVVWGAPAFTSNGALTRARSTGAMLNT